jgi:trimethyllysine dioxygenase
MYLPRLRQISLSISPKLAHVHDGNLIVECTMSVEARARPSQRLSPSMAQISFLLSKHTVRDAHDRDKKARIAHLWGKDLANGLPTTHYDDVVQAKSQVMNSDSGLANWLQNIHKFGIAFVRGVPPTEAATEALTKRIAHVRETHYGSVWSFTADLARGDLAYTNIGLAPHTDTSYFTDPVGLQLFHVLRKILVTTDHEGTGGESTYVDGFHAALQLREKHKWAWDALASIPVSAYSAGTEGYHLEPARPFTVFSLKDGGLHQIRYNNDDRAPLSESPEEFYAALQEYTKIVESKENMLQIKLEPGTVVSVDNWRVFHGRLAFTGKRRVCGAYVGHDDYMSRFRTVCK